MSPSTLSAGGQSYEIFPLEGAERLPYTLRILLENALRHGEEEDAEALAALAAATTAVGRDLVPTRARAPAGLHRRARPSSTSRRCATRWPTSAATRRGSTRSSRPSSSSTTRCRSTSTDRRARCSATPSCEFERNRERYAFLRWGQTAFDNFKVVPPNTGIVHQVNLEFLARVIEARDGQAFPDTLVGTDSHTTMINGLGVLGWGVGGIEAEAAMLGEAVSMLIPEVVGFKLTGAMPEGATATDLVLTVTQMLRAAGVVGKFVEYFGHGLVGAPARRPRDDRQHVARVRRDLRLLPGGRRDARSTCG